MLGLPGAPGWTTTGLPESVCCADTEGDKTPPKPTSIAKHRNGTAIFTTGLQDRTGALAIAMIAPITPLFAGDGLKFRVGERANLRVSRKHSRTGVPAQNRVVVSMRPEGFGSLVMSHRFPQRMVSVGVSEGSVLAEVRVGQAFPDETGVVCALVLAFDAGE